MSHVDGVVLAAGPSRRFRDGGGPSRLKQLLSFGGETLVRRAARTALSARLSRVWVVVGCEAEAVRTQVADLPVEVVENPRFEEGQSASVRAALAALDAEAAVFLPCDQPLLTAATLDRLVDAWLGSRAHIVVPVAAGRRGAPVLIARSLFDELSRIRGDAGARQIFAAHAGAIREVEIADSRELRDVDTREEYRRLLDLEVPGAD